MALVIRGAKAISIHVPREGDDILFRNEEWAYNDFNPRPP